jgi:polar amino acid transport system substrate-binding protein
VVIRGALMAVLVLIAVFCPLDEGFCGAVFDRVMKNGTVRLGLPYNLTPQGYLSADGEWVGFEIDLGTEMAKRMNLKLDQVRVNENTWATMLAAGRVDAALCRIKHTRTIEREFDFSDPYFFDSLQILVPKGSINRLADLKGQKIAAVQGSKPEKVAMAVLRGVGDESAEKNVVSVPDRAAAFLALGRGKVAGWIDSGMILLEYVSKGQSRFDMIPASDIVEPIAVALPENDSAWRDLVNYTLQEIAEDGMFRKIYEQWFGPGSPNPFPLHRPIDIWPQ